VNRAPARLAALLCLFLAGAASGQEKSPAAGSVATPAANPRGVYASIDLRPAQQLIQRLQAAAGAVRRPAMREVQKDAGSHMPPVLYALANALAEDDPEEAVFWYQVGRLRAVYDGLRCRDQSARSGVTTIGQGLSVPLRRQMFFQRSQLVAIARKAIDWDAKNPRNYDQRWIALYGRTAAISAGEDPNEILLPEGEWQAILAHVRDAHLKSVRDFAEQGAGKKLP